MATVKGSGPNWHQDGRPGPQQHLAGVLAMAVLILGSGARRLGITTIAVLLVIGGPALADVDDVGAYWTEIPIEVPAYHGLEPRIALAYNSNAGNGLVGIGWRLQASSTIVRVSASRGAPRFDATDIYLLDGGELVVCTPSSSSPSCTTAASAIAANVTPPTAVFYSTRIESYQRIAFDTLSGTWQVWSKTGAKATYVTADGGRTFPLSNIEDSHGNRVTYGAWCDGTYDCYLERITYAGTTTAVGAEVRFFFELRPDPIESGTGAGLRYTRYRLKSITVRMAGQLARAYALRYATSATTGASMLASVQPFGRDATVDAAGTITTAVMPMLPPPMLPPMTFETPSMAASPGAWEFPQITTQPNLPLIGTMPGQASYVSHYANVSVDAASCQDIEDDGYCYPSAGLTGDWNGDGKSDVLTWGIMTASCGSLLLKAILTQPSGASKEIITSLSTGITGVRSGNCMIGAWIADLDGDLKDDVLLYLNGSIRAAYSNGNGTFTPSATSVRRQMRISHCDVGDVNADGRTDLVCSDNTNSTLWLITLLTGLGGSFTVTSELLGAQGIGDHRLVLADVDGDSDSDVVLANKTNGTWTLVTGLSEGDGTWIWESQATPWTYGANENDLLLAGDFDGDGKDDVLLDRVFASGTADEIYVGLSAKGAISGRFVLVDPSTPWARAISVGDVNGDGKTDLMLKDSLTAALADGTGWLDPPPAGTPVSCDVLHPADVNGDGKADYLCVEEGIGSHSFRDRVSPNVGEDMHRWMPADVDGDGISEFVYVHHRNPGYEVYTIFPDTNTRTSQTIFGGAVPGLNNPDVARWLLIDVGGPSGSPDGRADLVFVDKVAGTLGVYTLLSNGDGTWQARTDTPWKDSTGAVVDYGAEDLQHWSPAELNGDGRVDLLHTYFLGSGVRVEYLLSSGYGTWTSGAHDYFTATAPPLDALTIPAVQDFRLLDVNGDGLTDLVHAEYVGSANVGTRLRTLLSSGDGTFVPRQWSATVPYRVDARRWRPMDANGDGMSDLVHVRYTGNGVVTCLDIEILISQGNGSWTWQSYGTACHVAATIDERNLLEDSRFVRLMDVNADGRTDLVHVSDYWDSSRTRKTAIVMFQNSPAGGGSWVKTVQKNIALPFYANDSWVWQVWGSPWTGGVGLVYANPQHLYAMQWRAPSDRMTGLSNGLGASTTVSYGLLIGHRSYLPSGMIPIVTDAVEVSDGAYMPPRTERTTYDYDGARWSDRDRRLLGFGVRIGKTGGMGILATYRLSDECGAQLMASEQRQVSGSTLGALFQSTHFSYGSAGTSAPYTCLFEQEERREHELQSSYRPSRRSYRYDAFGNVVRLHEEGDPSNNLDDRLTESVVYPNQARYLVGLPAFTIMSGVSNASGSPSWSLLSSTLHEYDGNTTYTAPPGALGELTRRREWNSQTSTYITTEFEYDTAGNVTRTTDPAGIWKSVTFDPTYALFPTSECNALFCTLHTWDIVLGLLTASIDPNAQTTSHSYDAYGRLVRTDRPDGSFTRVQYLSFGAFTGQTAGRQRIRIEESDGSSGDGVLGSESYFDGLGRTYRTLTEGGITRETEFVGASARTAGTTAPYAPGETPAWTRFRYDDARRVVTVEKPDHSTVRTIYDVGTVTTTDEMGHDEVRSFDAHGRVWRIEEKNQPCATCARQSQFTHYAYDGLDRLISIMDHAGHLTTITWDTLSHQTKMCDPDRGCQTYTFRDNGQLETRTDAKGQLTRWSYDTLGRPVRKEEVTPAGTVSRTVAWTYDRDPATNTTQGLSLGRLVREDYAGTTRGSIASWYDAMGRVTRSRQCVDGICAELGYGFDLAGRVATIDYPDTAGLVSQNSERVIYTYDASGRLASIGGYVSNLAYNGSEQLTLMTYANGVRTQNAYDASRGWLDSINVSDNAGNTPFRAVYTHDPIGRIRQIQTWNPTYVSTWFDFDELGRLRVVASTDSAQNQSFMYDAIGNMTYNSKLGDYHYQDPDHVHAVTRTDNGDQYAYDANGNMERARDLVITWTHNDMPASILNRSTGVSAVMVYDPAGRRVKRTVSGVGTTYSFGPLVERAEAGGWIKYYYAGDRLVAHRDEANHIVWYSQDHLHSTRVMTDGQASVVNRYEYLAYGEKVASTASVPTDHTTFGGKDDDGLSGLVYLNARYYDPKLGRFLSADSLVPAIYRPQSLNRYSYVENDPVNFWDPSGHMPMRVELKKEIEARSRAAYAGVSSGCSFGTGSADLFCSAPVGSWGEIFAGATPVKLNAQGEIVLRRVSVMDARGERFGVWERKELPPWSVFREPEAPLSPPPLVSLEEADAPYLTTADEWDPFLAVQLDGTIVAILAGDIVDVDRIEVFARQMEIRDEAFQQAFHELQISLTNPLMWMPMFTPGMGTKGIEIGWGFLLDLALTADDFNDWIGPFFRMYQRVAGSEAEALRWFQADRQATADRANYRLLTEILNQKFGLYWAWQDRPQGATQANQHEDLTRKLNRAGLYWFWQTSPNP